MPKTPVTKERVNVTIDAELIAEARRLNIKVSRAAEFGLRRIVEEVKRDQAINREVSFSEVPQQAQ